MFYWNQKRLKELKEQGYKIKFYNYDPRFKDQTIEEIDDQGQEDKEDTQS